MLKVLAQTCLVFVLSSGPAAAQHPSSRVTIGVLGGMRSPVRETAPRNPCQESRSPASPPVARAPRAAKRLRRRREPRRTRAFSLDHLVGAGENRGGNVQFKVLGGFQIDHK